MGEMTSVAGVHVVEGRPWKDALISVVEPRSPYRPLAPRSRQGARPGRLGPLFRRQYPNRGRAKVSEVVSRRLARGPVQLLSRHDAPRRVHQFSGFPIRPTPTLPVLLGPTLDVNGLRVFVWPGGRTLDYGDGLLRKAVEMAVRVVRPQVVAVGAAALCRPRTSVDKAVEMSALACRSSSNPAPTYRSGLSEPAPWGNPQKNFQTPTEIESQCRPGDRHGPGGGNRGGAGGAAWGGNFFLCEWTWSAAHRPYHCRS